MVNEGNKKSFKIKKASKNIIEQKKTKKVKKELKEKDIKKLGEKIKEIKKISSEYQQRITRKIFLSMFMNAIVMFVFIFILMGYNNIPISNYIVDLKVFSIIAILITICIFEYAYKKDNGFCAIMGVESLVASFIILSLYYILQYEIFNYKYYLLTFTLMFIVYYSIKTIIIYNNEVSKYRKNDSDIKRIIKKEEI